MRSLFSLALLAIPMAPELAAQQPLPQSTPDLVRRVRVPRGTSTSTDLASPRIYSNRCTPSAWYPQCGEETFYDWGRLPSPSSQVIIGGATTYRIDGLELGYVTAEADPSMGGPGPEVELNFWSLGVPCADPSLLGTPDKTLVLSGLPGSMTPGSFETVLVEIDLAALGEEFDLAADGDGIYDHDPNLDLFTWSIQFRGMVQGQTGPLLAGDPVLCPDGAGTVWSLAGGDGTGISTANSFWVETPVSPSSCGLVEGCVTFQGIQNSFYLGLHADPVVVPQKPGYAFCFGIDCPCGNDDRDYGCANENGSGAFLRGSGSASVAADDLALTSFGLKQNSFAIVFHGGAATVPMPFRNANLCVGPGGGALGLYRYEPPQFTGPFGAFTLQQVVSKSQAFPAAARIQPGDTWYFQAWYRDAGACGQGSNLTNAYAVSFLP